MTLLVDFGDQFAIVMDTSNGFWFLPGGGVEQNESIEETAKREAAEELGLEIKINRLIKTFHVTLITREMREQLEIPPFIAMHATPIRGQIKTEYAPNRKIILIKKKHCKSLLQSFKIPREYECMKPYHYISKEVIRQTVTC
ncbi:MAG: NUDIX hydrolase [Candidatus Bathyarchaeia archaeon]